MTVVLFTFADVFNLIKFIVIIMVEIVQLNK